jgi:hypothetical protein
LKDTSPNAKSGAFSRHFVAGNSRILAFVRDNTGNVKPLDLNLFLVLSSSSFLFFFRFLALYSRVRIRCDEERFVFVLR